MTYLDEQKAHRILVIDDNPSIHKDFETILLDDDDSCTLSSLRSEVFGNGTSTSVMKTVYQLGSVDI